MRVRNRSTGKELMVVKINYPSGIYPSSQTTYVLEDGRVLTHGEIWAEFVQVPEMKVPSETTK